MKQQRGMTLISWILVLGLIAFFTVLTARLFPMYQEYYGVVKVMNSLEKEVKEGKLNKNQVYILLMRKFNTGYISSVKKENIEILPGKKVRHITKVVIDYEVREPFMFHIDLVGHFHQEFDVEPKNK